MQKYTKKPVRKLTAAEISTLAERGCCADDWNGIEVTEGFDASSVRNCRFRGKVTIGAKVFISNIGGYIANMRIADGAYIENTGVIETTGESTFGIGTQVKTINESGGREVPIYPALSAQIAYLTAIYRDHPKAIARINEMVEREYIAPVRGDIGLIGEGARITGCGTLRNVVIDGDAIIEGCEMLNNTTIVSKTARRTYIGPGAKMFDSVAASGAVVTNGGLLQRCFVAGATKVSALSGADSLIFSNSQCENGEVCSIFAGPFTITHHRSTLLIAGMFSFFNAGSGSNMSNHLFKCGPVHQGVFRRGVKLGSNAYVMLPALVGAYTTIIGRHRGHPDTDDFPFSMLIEDGDGTYLVPGVNLGSCGTARDIVKWVKRDIREESSPDVINFNENNPFITQKILRAIDISEQLLSKEEVDVHNYHRIKIKATMMKRGLRLYQLARDRCIGSMMARREDRVATGYAIADTVDGTGSWIDAAGMYMPKKAMDMILDWLENGTDCSLAALQGNMEALYRNYKHYAANWAQSILEEDLGRKATAEDISAAIQRSRIAAPKLLKLIEDDERRERDAILSASYGLDADDDFCRMEDYNIVRRID